MPTKLFTQQWLLPLGGLLALVGYFGPWIDHSVSGLVITGLDLAEYVKFLTTVRSRQVSIWREAFFLPLFAVSLAYSLSIYRPKLRYPLWVKVLMTAIAIIAALNMLPPAWTPSLLLTPEFRTQTIMLLFCLTAIALSPFLALIPESIANVIITIFASITILLPVMMFLRVLPTITTLYNTALRPGWGMYTMIMGLAMLITGSWIGQYVHQSSAQTTTEQPITG